MWEPLADAELNRAVELLNDGLSVTDVAEEMGVSRATGYRLRKRAIEQELLEA
jgi:transposase